MYFFAVLSLLVVKITPWVVFHKKNLHHKDAENSFCGEVEVAIRFRITTRYGTTAQTKSLSPSYSLKITWQNKFESQPAKHILQSFCSETCRPKHFLYAETVFMPSW